jgi:hypothetical protein
MNNFQTETAKSQAKTERNTRKYSKKVCRQNEENEMR